MSWRKVNNIAKKSVQNAGIKLANDRTDKESLNILNRFRYAHDNPSKRLLHFLNSGPWVILSARRLKRTPSIVDKVADSIDKKNTTSVSRMQDIWWCRCVFENVNEVYAYLDWLRYNPPIWFFEKKNQFTDYIKNPKWDWYRWIHIVYEVVDNTKEAGLMIEVQLRTKLQHSRATSLEIIDLTKKSKLKRWWWESYLKKFFEYTSIVFQRVEWVKISKFTKALYQLPILDKKYGIINMLENRAISYSFQFRFIEYNKKNRNETITWDVILEIKKDWDRIMVTPHKDLWDTDQARQLYIDLETKYINDNNMDIVYLSSDEISEAYPNYAWDAELFIKYYNDCIKKYSK